MWTVALRFSAWTHEPQGPSSLSSSCPPFQPSFLFLVTSDLPVIKLNFVLLVKAHSGKGFSESGPVGGSVRRDPNGSC